MAQETEATINPGQGWARSAQAQSRPKRSVAVVLRRVSRLVVAVISRRLVSVIRRMCVPPNPGTLGPERPVSGVWSGQHAEDGRDVSWRTRRGRILALGVVPMLVVGLVLGPKSWALLTAGIRLPVPVAGFGSGAAMLWPAAALVAWVALWAAGEDTHPGKRTGRTARRVVASATVAVRHVTGTFVGNAQSEAECGHGRDAVIGQLIPLGGV